MTPTQKQAHELSAPPFMNEAGPMHCPSCGYGEAPAGALCPRCRSYLPASAATAASIYGEAKSGTSGLAIASLLLGIWGVLFIVNRTPLLMLPFGLASIITGHLAKRRIRESSGQLSGARMATAGLILSYPFVVLFLVVGGLTIMGDFLREIFGGSASSLPR